MKKSNLMEGLKKVEDFAKVVRKPQKVVRKLEKSREKTLYLQSKGYSYDHEGSIDSPN
jgi:hypothetical protein